MSVQLHRYNCETLGVSVIKNTLDAFVFSPQYDTVILYLLVSFTDQFPYITKTLTLICYLFCLHKTLAICVRVLWQSNTVQLTFITNFFSSEKGKNTHVNHQIQHLSIFCSVQELGGFDKLRKSSSYASLCSLPLGRGAEAALALRPEVGLHWAENRTID